jgi:UDP-N-acetylbacillosamine N-acetyltransferase
MEAILVGGFIEIVELCESCNIKIIGIFDNRLQHQYCNYPILGNDQDAAKLFGKYHTVPVIISPDLPNVRIKLVKYYLSLGYSFIKLISPKAEVSRSSVLGEGTVIQSFVNISSNVHIGAFVKLNTFANIMHDCIIGDFTTIAPNAVLLGRVKVEDQCYIGANATILPQVTIHGKAIVGAGSVVVKDIEKNKTVKGVPAR